MKTAFYKKIIHRIEGWIGNGLASYLPQHTLHILTSRLAEKYPMMLVGALGPQLNRKPNLDNMPFDIPLNDRLQFEHLGGLFASTPLDHAVIAMTIRQSAYLFGLVRKMKVQKVIEIGRYKGGSTFLIASAMNGQGQFWSIDIGEKESRLHDSKLSRTFDDQLNDLCKRFGLGVNIIVGDSKTVNIDTGEVDLVFIDGDHTYESVKNDFERFGNRVRVGGALLFDDAYDDDIFKAHSDTVGRLVQEILEKGAFKLVKVVNSLAHLEKVRQNS